LVPVPILRRRPGGRRFRFDMRPALRKAPGKGRKARAPPGELVQIDSLFVNLRFRQGDQTLHRLLDKLFLAHPSK
jgi:putative transposase